MQILLIKSLGCEKNIQDPQNARGRIGGGLSLEAQAVILVLAMYLIRSWPSLALF